MKEYIDRHAAIESSLAFLVEYLGGAFDEGLQEKLKTKIKTIPAADVVPVVHGEWERIPYSFAGGYRCSCCGQKTMENFWLYCPNCCAKMNGGDEHE